MGIGTGGCATVCSVGVDSGRATQVGIASRADDAMMRDRAHGVTRSHAPPRSGGVPRPPDGRTAVKPKFCPAPTDIRTGSRESVMAYFRYEVNGGEFVVQGEEDWVITFNGVRIGGVYP